MYIPIREPENTQDQNFKDFGKCIISESAHAFDEQYSWAMKTAEIAYTMLTNGVDYSKVLFNNATDKTLKGCKLKIETGNLLQTTATLSSVDDLGFVSITLYPNGNILKKKKEDVIFELFDAIVHEFGHGYIYWRKSYGGFKKPKDYDNWLMILNDKNVPSTSLLFWFCYGLYCTFYHEAQAFISQTYSSLLKICIEKYATTEISKDCFMEALKECNSVRAFSNSINSSTLLIQNNAMRTEIIKQLSLFGLNYNEHQVLLLCKKILKTSKDSLKACYNNAYCHFYKNLKK